MKIKNWYNAKEFEAGYEKPAGPSKTIPDQSLTVAQLVERNKRGLPLGGGKNPVYNENVEDEFFPDINRLDLAEIQQLKEQAARTIQEKQVEMQKLEAERRQKELDTLNQQISELSEKLKQTQTLTPPGRGAGGGDLIS